jgi:hypothetical protein
MAHLIPSDLAPMARCGWLVPELETLNHLRAKLPAEYTVFHSVHWTREERRGTAFGECHVVVVNQAGRVLVIEQKNGSLEETPGGLVKVYSDGSKSVAEQIQRTLDGLRRKFRQVHRAHGGLELDYLLFCPDHHVKHVNAAALDASSRRRPPRCTAGPRGPGRGGGRGAGSRDGWSRVPS